MNRLTNEYILSEEEAIKEELKKFWLLKRFLDWIAKGTDESSIGGTACPF